MCFTKLFRKIENFMQFLSRNEPKPDSVVWVYLEDLDFLLHNKRRWIEKYILQEVKYI